MPLVELPGMRPVRMGEMDAELTRRPDGSLHVRSKYALGPHPRSMIDCLDHWAAVAPDRVFLADRGPDGEWRRVTFAEARRKARAVAQFLIDKDLSADRPLMILSGNSVEHGLLALGAMTAGIPFAPVSPAYSLVSTDHSKLKYLVGLLTPGMIFAAEGSVYEKALSAIMAPGMDLVVARDPAPGMDHTPFDAVLATSPGGAV
ncbi:MAG: AMP-binding protein, partial [Mesorhizobium sp.]|nr:AMP-binding protein [Mesorhizobium sp.]